MPSLNTQTSLRNVKTQVQNEQNVEKKPRQGETNHQFLKILSESSYCRKDSVSVKGAIS
jgi:hypothetical protein